MVNLQSILKPLSNELSSVEKEIHRILSTNNIVRLNPHIKHLLRFKGKKLRPSLLLLTKFALDDKKKHSLREAITAAASIELFHRASLVHDDIIDRSTERHHQKTAFAIFGTDESIVLGDWAFSTALELVALQKNLAVRSQIAKAVTSIIKGQLLQMRSRNDFSNSKRHYYDVITLKTASLFFSATASGALLSNKPNLNNVARQFGYNFGIAFQIIDDLEDLVGDINKTGKNALGQDLREGEITLPLLYLYKELSTINKALMKSTFNKSSTKDINKILSLFKKSEALRKTKKEAVHYLLRAKNNLRYYPKNDVTLALERLIQLTHQKVEAY